MHTKVRGDLLEGHAGITATSYANDVVAELTGIWLGHVDILSGRPPRQARSVVTDSRGSPTSLSSARCTAAALMASTTPTGTTAGFSTDRW